MLKQAQRWIALVAIGVMTMTVCGGLGTPSAQAGHKGSKGHRDTDFILLRSSKSKSSSKRHYGWTKGHHYGWSKSKRHYGWTRGRRTRTRTRRHFRSSSHSHRHRHGRFWHTHWHTSGHHR